MRTLVVVESIWGNAEAIGRAIAAGIGGTVDVVTAEDAPRAIPAGVDLVVVGGPAHVFSMTSVMTRESARRQGATIIPSRGIREWIDGLPRLERRVLVATFEIRTVSPRLPGSAAKIAMKRLVERGLKPAAKPETFHVHDHEGPVVDGELTRATEWGATLARDVSV